jgi:serine protease Do
MFISVALQTLLVVYPVPREPAGPDKGPGYLGVAFQPANEGGILVTEVHDKSPAQQSGVRVNDVIYKFDGQVLGDTTEFVKLIVRTRPGSIVPTEVLREGRKLTIKLKVGVRPEDFPYPLPDTLPPPIGK